MQNDIRPESMARITTKELADAFIEEQIAEVQKNMDAMADAETGGLSVYTRRADAAEAKINQ